LRRTAGFFCSKTFQRLQSEVAHETGGEESGGDALRGREHKMHMRMIPTVQRLEAIRLEGEQRRQKIAKELPTIPTIPKIGHKLPQELPSHLPAETEEQARERAFAESVHQQIEDDRRRARQEADEVDEAFMKNEDLVSGEQASSLSSQTIPSMVSPSNISQSAGVDSARPVNPMLEVCDYLSTDEEEAALVNQLSSSMPEDRLYKDMHPDVDLDKNYYADVTPQEVSEYVNPGDVPSPLNAIPNRVKQDRPRTVV
ncbi:MAG TPA: hypothetical protein V6C97_00675, partial [Oculatellaceae cyanobacterium]